MWATMKNTIKIKHIYKILQTTNFQTVASENVTMQEWNKTGSTIANKIEIWLYGNIPLQWTCY